MLLKSSAKSGLLKIFWAKKCWLYWSRLWLVWTSEVNLLLRVLYIILQGTRSGTTNGTLSWWRRQRALCMTTARRAERHERMSGLEGGCGHKSSRTSNTHTCCSPPGHQREPSQAFLFKGWYHLWHFCVSYFNSVLPTTLWATPWRSG